MEHSSKYFSHPNIPLKDHLIAVGSLCEHKMSNIIDDTNLINISKLLGVTHDFGKYTNFFQEYLNGKHHNNELKSHAPLSSLYIGWLLLQEKMDPFLIFASMLAVYSHHRSIDKEYDELDKVIRRFIDGYNNYAQQLRSLRENKDYISQELQEMGLPPLDEFLEWIDKKDYSLNKVLYRFYHSNKGNYDLAFERLYTLLLLFSILIDSDKKVTRMIKEPERREIESRLVDLYLQNLDASPLDDLRNNIRLDILNNFVSIINSTSIPRIFSINAPTGSGKTLLSLTIALRLREEVKKRTGKLYRIIYVLPYINIIEQTYSIFKEVLNNEELNLIMKHHHHYFPPEDDKQSVEDKLMLIESWDSEVIVTTFVNFMETLIGTKNRMLKKFNKLYNSIIILDELQTVPIDYWLLLKHALISLSKYSYIIFMTATRPSIFNEYCELLPQCEKYFKRLDRVKYRVYNNEMSIEEAADYIVQNYKGHNTLVIVNTIKTSIKLYERIKELLSNNVVSVKRASEYFNDPDLINKPLLVYLSTNIIPRERFDRIRLIKLLMKKKKRVIVISTQLVEAGVDLDFEQVIRDIGPFDSIIQAGGRCNRNWEDHKGEVNIIKIRSNDLLDAEIIYGRSTIAITNEILKEKEEFDESEVFSMIDKYYNLVKDKLQALERDHSKYYLKSISSLNLKELSTFRVIKEEPKISIFVELDERSTELLKEFKAIYRKVSDEREDRYERVREMRIGRSKIEDYIIETWYKEGISLKSIDENINYIYHLTSEDIDKYYDHETGLRISLDEVNESYLLL